MTTPAQNAGFKVGSYYKLIRLDGEPGLKVGSIVKFTKDDGSSCPQFNAEGFYGEDGWGYLSLEQLDLTERDKDGNPKENTIGVDKQQITVNLDRVGGLVSLKIEGQLTKAQVAAIMEIAYG